MESKENAGEGQEKDKKCCSGNGCRCCGGKVIAAIALILLGGIIGFLMGQGGLCGKKSAMCASHMGGSSAMKSCPMVPETETPKK